MLNIYFLLSSEHTLLHKIVKKKPKLIYSLKTNAKQKKLFLNLPHDNMQIHVKKLSLKYIKIIFNQSQDIVWVVFKYLWNKITHLITI